MRRSSIDGIMGGCIPVFFHRASTLEAQYRWHERQGGRYYVLMLNLRRCAGREGGHRGGAEQVHGQASGPMREELITMILYRDPG